MPFQTTIEDDVIREYSSARAIVERILDKIPRTRDMFDDEFREYVYCYCMTCDLTPSPYETIRRVRQKIQNTEKKYQASERVQQIRRERAEAVKKNIKYI